jgi:preprotein translocase subunit YajC
VAPATIRSLQHARLALSQWKERMNFAYQLLSLFVLAQAGEDGAAAPVEAAKPAGDADGGGGFGIFNNPLLPLVVIGIMFYFLLILPERKKRKELENKLNSLKKNDAVITTGGVCGIIVNANPGSKYVTLKIDEANNTKIRVLRSHIAHIGSPDEVDEKDIKEKKDA